MFSRLLFSIAMCALCCITAFGRTTGEVIPEPHDSIRVSLITCWPGPEVYELCGHEAIRVTTPGSDMVWNYGTFDFNQPNFIGRFVSGQTDYKVVSYPFEWFMPEYERRGSRVEEQELLLTATEKQRLLEALRRNALPENATYRYNYVYDNCATRITAMLDSMTDRRILFPDSTRYGTFRKAMRRYHRDYPWYQFGIDLVLGSGLDRSISRREEMFVPVEMHDAFSQARFEGTDAPAAAPATVLFAGTGQASLPPTPWYLTPMAAAVAVLVISAACSLWTWKRHRLPRWWYSVFFSAAGLAGCLVTYLVFFSSHEATSPNLMLIWLNPLQLILALGVWYRSWRYICMGVAVYDIAATLTTLVAWHAQAQSAPPAAFPLMASVVVLAATYAIFSATNSYIRKGVTTPPRNPKSTTTKRTRSK